MSPTAAERIHGSAKSNGHNRVGVACVYCRKRKVKCSGIQDCETCMRLNRACVYTTVQGDKVVLDDEGGLFGKKRAIKRSDKVAIKKLKVKRETRVKGGKGFGSLVASASTSSLGSISSAPPTPLDTPVDSPPFQYTHTATHAPTLAHTHVHAYAPTTFVQSSANLSFFAFPYNPFGTIDEDLEELEFRADPTKLSYEERCRAAELEANGASGRMVGTVASPVKAQEQDTVPTPKAMKIRKSRGGMESCSASSVGSSPTLGQNNLSARRVTTVLGQLGPLYPVPLPSSSIFAQSLAQDFLSAYQPITSYSYNPTTTYTNEDDSEIDDDFVSLNVGSSSSSSYSRPIQFRERVTSFNSLSSFHSDATSVDAAGHHARSESFSSMGSRRPGISRRTSDQSNESASDEGQHSPLFQESSLFSEMGMEEGETGTGGASSRFSILRVQHEGAINAEGFLPASVGNHGEWKCIDGRGEMVVE